MTIGAFMHGHIITIESLHRGGVVVESLVFQVCDLLKGQLVQALEEILAIADWVDFAAKELASNLLKPLRVQEEEVAIGCCLQGAMACPLGP